MLMSDTANEQEVETDNSCVHGQQPLASEAAWSHPGMIMKQLNIKH